MVEEDKEANLYRRAIPKLKLWEDGVPRENTGQQHKGMERRYTGT